MRQTATIVLALLSGLCSLTGCGDPPQRAAPHGLVVPTLDVMAPGPLLDPLLEAKPGHWVGGITKRWTETREGLATREGFAEIGLEVKRRETPEGLETTLELEVRVATGLAEEYVRGFSGVRVAARHGEDGRPDPATLRFETQAPDTARSFLAGFWSAGIVGNGAWYPPGPLREKDTWSRAALGRPPGLDALRREYPDALPSFEGGGQLVGASEDALGRTWDIRLGSLVGVDAATHDDAISLGVLDEGRGSFSPASGLPRTWSLVEVTRLSRLERGSPRRFEVRLEVEGHLEPAASDPR